MHASLLLIHIWWPLVMGLSLATVVGRATGRPWQAAGTAMLALGIVVTYSLDRLRDAPRAMTPQLWRALAAVTAAAALATALLLPFLPRETAVLVPLFGVVAALYPVLKRFTLGKTVVVPAIWTWGAIALPFNDGAWFGWHWLFEPIALPLFLLLAAGCLLCDLKDEAADRHAGVHSLPASIGSPAAARVASALALAAATVAWAEGRPAVTCGGLALGVVAWWPALLATEIIGPLLVDVVLTIPGLLILTRVV